MADKQPQSIRRLITANLDRFSHMPEDKIAERVIAEVDPLDWDRVLLPLVVDAVRVAARARARDNEELLRLMPLVADGVQLEIDPTEATDDPVTMLPAPLSGQPSEWDRASVVSLPTGQPSGPAQLSASGASNDRPSSICGPRSSARRPFPGTVLNRDLRTWLLERRDLLDSRFKLGNGVETTMALATVEQHRERAEALASVIAGTRETLDLHRKIIANLEVTGASCLADLMKEDKAA